MRFKYNKFPIGLRTIKTAAAVIVSMLIVTSYGATTLGNDKYFSEML